MNMGFSFFAPNPKNGCYDAVTGCSGLLEDFPLVKYLVEDV